jgi:hypothetical protein
MGRVTSTLRSAFAGRGLLAGLFQALVIGGVALVFAVAAGEDRERPLADSPRAVEQTSSSGRALLDWWRRLASGASAFEIQSHYARSAGVGTAALRRQLRPLRYLFPEVEPRIVQVEESESEARVVTVMVRRPMLQSGERGPAQHSAQSFKLVREGSRWKLADNSYLDQLAAAEAATLRQREN